MENNVFVFNLVFRDLKQNVWRRFTVSSEATFWELHVVIQGILGWSNTRLHEFIVQRIEPKQAQRIMPVNQGFNDLPLLLSQKTTIKNYFDETQPPPTRSWWVGDLAESRCQSKDIFDS